MKKTFEIASGSVIGRDHVKDLGWRNNQDAVVTMVSNEAIIAVVADGCSAAEQSTISHNEIGAHIGVRIIAEAIHSRLLDFTAHSSPGDIAEPVWDSIRFDILCAIQGLARSMGGSFSKNIRDYFLFTVLGTLITPIKTYVFSIGDGVEIINGEHYPIGPFPDNQPPYLAYSLVSSSIDPDLCGFSIRRAWQTSDVETMLLGTDGVGDLIKAYEQNLPGKEKLFVGPISQFWENDNYFHNPDQVRRKLALINCAVTRVSPEGEIVRFPGLLQDDTTLAVIRRRKQSTTKE